MIVSGHVSGLGPCAADQKPFTTMPISYDRAYGGVDEHEKRPGKIRTYPDNPIGVGYYPLSRGALLVGRPLANLHPIGKDASRRKGGYRPLSFGPMSRNFKTRIAYAGTYDQKWMDQQAPFSLMTSTIGTFNVPRRTSRCRTPWAEKK